jgi:hypothetical protein
LVESPTPFEKFCICCYIQNVLILSRFCFLGNYFEQKLVLFFRWLHIFCSGVVHFFTLVSFLSF